MNVRVAKGQAPVRHVPFAPDAKGYLVGYKKSSNDMNVEGKPRANACLNCIKAIGQQAVDQPYGRGTSGCQEPFSCLVAMGYGSGGINCARCVGLNTACQEVPEGFVAAAKALIARMTDFNAAAKVDVEARTPAQKATISSLISDCKKFASRTENTMKAAKKNEVVGSPGGVRGGIAGDQPVTRSEFARLERKIDQLFEMVSEGNDRVFLGARYARESRNDAHSIYNAWKSTARNEELCNLDRIRRYAQESEDEDEEDRPAKRQRII